MSKEQIAALKEKIMNLIVEATVTEVTEDDPSLEERKKLKFGIDLSL